MKAGTIPHLQLEILDGTPDAAFDFGFLLSGQAFRNGPPPVFCLRDSPPPELTFQLQSRVVTLRGGGGNVWVPLPTVFRHGTGPPFPGWGGGWDYLPCTRLWVAHYGHSHGRWRGEANLRFPTEGPSQVPGKEWD